MFIFSIFRERNRYAEVYNWFKSNMDNWNRYVLNCQCNCIGKVYPNVLGRVHKLLHIWYDVNCMAFMDIEFTCIYDYFPYWIYYCYCLQFSVVSSATTDETERENNIIDIFQKHPFTEKKMPTWKYFLVGCT